MKRLWFLLCLLAVPAFAQNNIRWDAISQTTTGTGQLLPMLAIPGVGVAFYSGCTVLPCTTPAVTYQAQAPAIACPAATPVVWQLPIQQGCVGTADSQGNFGGWFQPGYYQYVLTVNGKQVGPYAFSVGGSSGGGGGGAFLPLAGGTLYGALFAPNINGEVYPAQCANTPAASWCSGTTADAWIRAACTTLPATGGVINLMGLSGTIAASVPCSTKTKQVIILQDPSRTLTVTEADGGTVFPIDNGSMFLGPSGAGQSANNVGIKLAATANVTAIIGNARTDGTQENMTVEGVTLFGASGATVSQALIFAKNIFANTSISNNNVFVCNTACGKVVNGSDISLENNWFNVSDGVNTITGNPLIIQGTGLGAGCNVSTVSVRGGTYEHSLGGGAEITILGDGAGALACSISVENNVHVERNGAGTPSVTGIQVTDCQNCTINNVTASGTAGGVDVVNVAQTASGRVANVVLGSLSNIFGAYTNTVNDTTAPVILSGLAVPYVTDYYANPGYVQPPVIPGTVPQSLGADVMAGAGSFPSGSGTFGANFSATGCQSAQGLTCTYTRTNSTAPPGSTFSQQVQISSNTDPSEGFNGIQYGPSVTVIAGTSYVASFWAKGDGTFAGLPAVLVWNPSIPTFYCQSVSNNVFQTAWTLMSFVCKPNATVTGTNLLAIAAQTPFGATGTFWLGGFTFNIVQPLTVGSLLAAVAPYGIGPATLTTIGTSGPATISGGTLNIPQYSAGGSGVSSINSATGAFTFNFSAGAGSCSGTTCTFSGSGTGGGSVTSFAAPSGSWPTWLVPTVTNSTTTPSLAVAASAIPNSALANSAVTIGSTSVSLGATAATIAGLTLTSPTLTTPALGTPSGVVLTNGTGLPWAGLTGSPSTSQVPVQALTTSGTSGPATLSAGTLNIPQYSGGGGGGLPSGNGAVFVTSGVGRLGVVGTDYLNPNSTGTISIMDPAYGASCNWNGSTGSDDTGAIQSAVTAAGTNYASKGIIGTVVIPYGCTMGTGSGNTTVNVPSGVIITGPGSIFVPAQTTNALFQWTSTSDDTIQHLKITYITNLSGCAPSVNNDLCIAIRYDSANPGTSATKSRIKVLDNTILNSGWGILIGPQAGTDLLTDVVVDGNVISQTVQPPTSYLYNDGIHVGGAVSGFVISNNLITGRSDAGVAVSSEQSTVARLCHDGTITGNTLYEDRVGIDNSGCSNLQVTGNWVYADIPVGNSNPAFRSIFYPPGSSGQLPHNVNVVGNTFHNDETLSGSDVSAKFDCFGGCGNGSGTVNLMNSSFSGNKLQTFYANGSQINLSDNYFEDNAPGSLQNSITFNWDTVNVNGSYYDTIGPNNWQYRGQINFAGRSDIYFQDTLYPQNSSNNQLSINNQKMWGVPQESGFYSYLVPSGGQYGFSTDTPGAQTAVTVLCLLSTGQVAIENGPNCGSSISNATGALAAGFVNALNLTNGACVQAGLNGELLSASGPCGSGGGSSGITGGVTGFLPLFGSTTTITGNAHIDDGITTASTLTATESINITGGNALRLFGSTSGSAALTASSTGGTLNLGSTNATVTSAGALTVIGCTGCGITNLTGDVVATGPGSVASTVQSVGGGPTFASQASGPECNTTGTGVLNACTNLAVAGFSQVGTYSRHGVYNVPCTNTPVFDLSQGDTQILTLTTGCTAVTSSTVINTPASGFDQNVNFIIREDATGGYPFPNPTWSSAWTPQSLVASDQTTTVVHFYNYSAGSGTAVDNSGSAFCALSGFTTYACGQARSGFLVVASGTNVSTIVDTTAITSTGGIVFSSDDSIGSLVAPTVTCGSDTISMPRVTARTPGTSFTFTVPGTTTGNVCLFWSAVNR